MQKITRLALASVTLLSAVAAHADLEDRLFDFTDAYYLQNGVNPAMIAGRAQADGTRFVTGTPVRAGQRDVRALFTIGGWSDNEKPIFWTILGGLSGLGFTNDAAGVKARKLADRSPEYIFPQLGTNPTGLGAVRQNFILDRRHGYFSNNKLGLWLHVWVNYTPAAFNTSSGQKELEKLRKKNGNALDGTPIIRKISDIENLTKKGYVTQTTMPNDNNLRYAICPAIKDTDKGAIAPDQFLFTVRYANGQPTDPEIQEEFEDAQDDN